MIKFLVAIYLIVGGYKLAPDFRAVGEAFLLKKDLICEDCKETSKGTENTKTSEPEPENTFHFQSFLPLSIIRKATLTKTSGGYLKTRAGYSNPAFAPPDFI